MATAPGVNQGKTAFLDGFLTDHPEANREAINQAWREAGNEGEISESLFYKLRAKHGLTGKRGANGGASAGANAGALTRSKARSSKGKEAQQAAKSAEEAPSPTNGRADSAGAPSSGASAGTELAPAGARERVIDEVEAGIDDLIFTLKTSGGMPEVEAALRAARRLLTRSNGG